MSCGADNRYGHPNGETLARLDAAGVRVYRTDTEGAIRLTVYAPARTDGEPVPD